MTARIKQLTPAINSEALAVRTQINMDWLATLGGQPRGDIIFENQRFLQDAASGQYFAADGSTNEYALSRPISDALAFAMPLPEPITELTGAHVMTFIKAYHSARYEEQFNPPIAPVEDVAP